MRILVINSGSSFLKFQLAEVGLGALNDGVRPIAAGIYEGLQWCGLVLDAAWPRMSDE